jgi:hypothetical protein
MIAVPQITGIEIDPEAWSATPASIQSLVVYLVGENQAIATRVDQIEERLGQNSQNSSQPPSQDGFGKKVRPKREKSERNRGGQPGHGGHQPKLWDDRPQELQPSNFLRQRSPLELQYSRILLQ